MDELCARYEVEITFARPEPLQALYLIQQCRFGVRAPRRAIIYTYGIRVGTAVVWNGAPTLGYVLGEFQPSETPEGNLH